jgi:hypothetical protein
MRIVNYFIFFILIFPSCSDKPTLESQVMAIHDEVMPKMGDIHMAKKQLRKVMNESQNDSLNIEILQLITNLENADEGMMQWMDKWDLPAKDSEKKAYLKQEQAKITKVKVDLLSSLEAANQYLSKKK